MSRSARRTLVLALSALLVVSLSIAALGQSEGDGGGTGSTTTTVSGLQPAVEVAPDTSAPPPADWTYRYLIPTGLALAVIIVLITAVKYFTDVVRKRYRMVE